MRCASSTGWRTGTCSTHVPISTCRVTAAITLINTIGSSVGRPRPNASVTHNPAKPRASTCRAKSLTRSSVRPVATGSGRRTLTTCTLMTSASFRREKTLGEPGEKADPEGDRAVVEIVTRIVQQATALAWAVAEPHHRSRHGLQHVGEILAAERRRNVALDTLGAADLGRDV